jgi:hypothetical protein
VEQYLRIVTSASPKDWMSWLSIASAIHNNCQNDTTGLSPNQILWGHEVMLIPDDDFPIRNQTAKDCIEDLKKKWEMAISALNKKAGKIPTPLPY